MALSQQGGAASSAFIKDLGDNDVMLGRGTGPNDHVGNQMFRAFVDLQISAYLSAKTVEEQKRVFAGIIALVHSRGGRFVKKVGQLPAKKGSTKTMVYEVITDTNVLLYKIKHAFRYSREKKPSWTPTTPSTNMLPPETVATSTKPSEQEQVPVHPPKRQNSKRPAPLSVPPRLGLSHQPPPIPCSQPMATGSRANLLSNLLATRSPSGPMNPSGAALIQNQTPSARPCRNIALPSLSTLATLARPPPQTKAVPECYILSSLANPLFASSMGLANQLLPSNRNNMELLRLLHAAALPSGTPLNKPQVPGPPTLGSMTTNSSIEAAEAALLEAAVPASGHEQSTMREQTSDAPRSILQMKQKKVSRAARPQTPSTHNKRGND